jgi:hypothetical protein
MSQVFSCNENSSQAFWASFVVGFVCFVASVFTAPLQGAKIPVKIKSVFYFESSHSINLELLCLTRDNTEISIALQSPSQQVIYTAKALSSCSVKKEAHAGDLSLKMMEGRLTDELQSQSTRAPLQRISPLTTDYQVKMKATNPSKPKKKFKSRLSAKR